MSLSSRGRSSVSKDTCPYHMMTCLFSFHIRVRPQNLSYWAVYLSFLLQILAYHNFSSVCTTYSLCHRSHALGQRRLLRQSSRGCQRLHTLNLELIQHVATRTSPHTQPLSSGTHKQHSLSSHVHVSQTLSGSLRQSSPPASALGIRPISVFSNVDSNKKQKNYSSPSSPSPRPERLSTASLSTFVVCLPKNGNHSRISTSF